jgi:hypothetical protein
MKQAGVTDMPDTEGLSEVWQEMIAYCGNCPVKQGTNPDVQTKFTCVDMAV